MAEIFKIEERRTAVDAIFDHLHDEIVSMRLQPGMKISEAEIAKLFGVSRQPVRDAFSRLENLDLLLIRPQRATEVKRFSSKTIKTSRFVRLAVESEALRRAARNCSAEHAALLDDRLAEQRRSVEDHDYDRFRSLDYAFHQTICVIADADFAFDVISREKAKVDRLCALGMKRDDEQGQLLDDHLAIAEMLKRNDEQGAVDAGTKHLSRLDSTIDYILTEHTDYFYE